MMHFLVLRERLRNLYSKYDVYICAVLKGVLVLTALILMNINIGFVKELRSPLVVLAASVLCAFLPAGASAVVVGVVMLLHFSAVSVEVLLVAAAVMALMFILYFSFKPGNGWLLVLTLIMCFLHVPGGLVVAVGLIGTPLSAIPVIFGMLLYQLAFTVQKNYTALSVITTETGTMQKLAQMLDGIVKNQYWLLMIAAVSLTILAVYIIRRLPMNYSWAVAIGSGVLLFLLVTLTGNFAFDITIPVGEIGWSAAVSVVLGLIAYLVLFSVDYRGTEYVQFEDDDYYYYVKAVPKLSVSVPEVRIQKINARKIVQTKQEAERGQDHRRRAESES